MAGLPGDPVPGDPVVIKALAVSWLSLADDAEWAKNRVNALLADGAVMDWIGKAGDAFRAHSSDLPGQLDKASRSYRSASSALSVWSADLEGCQGSADKGLALAYLAQDDIAAAQRVLATARANEASARNASKTVSDTAQKYAHTAPPPGVQLPDPSQVAAAAQRATAANTAVTTAQHTVEDAQARLAAAKKLIGDAGHLRDDRATVAAASINAAAEEGIPPDSFWDDVGDVLSDVWHGIVEIAKIVVLVLGVVALIIGGPIAWVLFAAALVVLADTLINYAQGKASLLDVGLALLSCIPMTKGLTTLAELGAAFKAGGVLGAGAHLLGSAKTTIVGMAQGVRSLSGSLRTTVVDFAERAAGRRPVGDLGAVGGPGSGMAPARYPATDLPDAMKAKFHPQSDVPPEITAGHKPYGDLTEQEFASRYRDPNARAGRGGWAYPEGDYKVPGTERYDPPAPGTQIDRFGDENGSWLSPEGTPFTDRSLPPDSLGAEYHAYTVTDTPLPPDVRIETSQVAPWFEQPGGGLQHRIIGPTPEQSSVEHLLDEGYLR